MRRTILALCFMGFVALSAAQDEGDQEGASSQSRGAPNSTRDAQMRRRMQEQVRQLQRRHLERIKESHPDEYARQKDAMESQEQIDQIVAQRQAGEIGDKEAKEALFPLVKPRISLEADRLDDRIEQLEKELAFLKKAKRSPDLLVDRRIEELLGQRAPASDDPRCR